jgi:hypothetical protein
MVRIQGVFKRMVLYFSEMIAVKLQNSSECEKYYPYVAMRVYKGMLK